MTARVHLRAEAKLIHEGKMLVRGDPFTTRDKQEADDLVALHFASYVNHDDKDSATTTPPSTTTASTRSKPTLRRKDVVAKEEEVAPKPGRYSRRDMRAVD